MLGVRVRGNVCCQACASLDLSFATKPGDPAPPATRPHPPRSFHNPPCSCQANEHVPLPCQEAAAPLPPVCTWGSPARHWPTAVMSGQGTSYSVVSGRSWPPARYSKAAAAPFPGLLPASAPRTFHRELVHAAPSRMGCPTPPCAPQTSSRNQ